MCVCGRRGGLQCPAHAACEGLGEIEIKKESLEGNDGKMNVWEEITTRETRRKKSGGVPQMSASVKDMGVPVLTGYKGLGGNISHR